MPKRVSRVAGYPRRLDLRVHLAGRRRSRDRRFDLDLATFAIVKATRNDQQSASSSYRWEPKQAFHAVAEHYDAAG